MYLTGSYRDYIRSARWAATRAAYWSHPLTVKRCSVCGAPRLHGSWRGHTDTNHLRYRTVRRLDPNTGLPVRDERGRIVRDFLDPHLWELLPACHKPCHMWIVTPLSRHRAVRIVLYQALAATAILILGAPFVPVEGAAFAACFLLPRGLSAVLLGWLLGLPVRVARWPGRAFRFVTR